TPEVAAVRDADRIIGMLEARDLRNPRLIINRIRTDMVRRGDMMDIDDIIEILAIELLGVIPDDEAVIVATNRGEPVVLQSRGRCAEAYRNLVDRFLGKDVPIVALDGHSKLLERLRSWMALGRRPVSGYPSRGASGCLICADGAPGRGAARTRPRIASGSSSCMTGRPSRPSSSTGSRTRWWGSSPSTWRSTRKGSRWIWIRTRIRPCWWPTCPSARSGAGP